MPGLLMPLTTFQYGLYKVTQYFKGWTLQCSGKFNMSHHLFSAVLSGLNLHLQKHVTSVSTQSNQLPPIFFAKLREYFMDSCQNVTFGKEDPFVFCAGSITRDHINKHLLFLQIHLNLPLCKLKYHESLW